jgi:hypothetical protein
LGREKVVVGAARWPSDRPETDGRQPLTRGWPSGFVLEVLMLLDAKPPKPKTGIQKYISLPLLVIVVAIVGGVAFYAFHNYPEELVISKFLTEVQRGNYQQAYKIWQPSSEYSFTDFMHDWGPQGDYGKIHNFDILHTRSMGSRSVVITVRINNENPPLNLVVDRKDKGIAYSPF